MKEPPLMTRGSLSLVLLTVCASPPWELPSATYMWRRQTTCFRG